MHNSPLNFVPGPTSPQLGNSTQSDEGTTSRMKKTKEELFALAEKLVALGPSSMKIAVIIQFEENQEFQEYGSPDVRDVVDDYIRLSSERIVSEPRVHLTDENPELEETALSTEYPRPPKRRGYESSISPASVELPFGTVRNYEHRSRPVQEIGPRNDPRLAKVSYNMPPITRMSYSHFGILEYINISEQPEEEPRDPRRKFRHEPPTWALAELPSRNSSDNTNPSSSQASSGKSVAPWGDSDIQPRSAGSSKIIEEGVHDNRHRVSSLESIDEWYSFLQNSASSHKPSQSDTANVHEDLTLDAVSDHVAEPHRESLANTASLIEENTEKS